MENEIDYGAVFGITETGEEVTEVAEPSENTQPETGEEVAEVAEPSGDTETEGAGVEEAGAEDASVETSGVGERKTAQAPEERARYAAARRKAEAQRDEAIRQAKADAQKLVDEAFRDSGLTNPYTKQKITSKADYDAYKARFDAERKSVLLKKSGMSEEEFGKFVETLPEVQAAKSAKENAERVAQEAAETRARERIDADIRAITAMDPSVKSLDDLKKTENYNEIYALVQRGYTILDAFRVANFDRLTTRTTEAAVKAAAKLQRGKEHLSATAQRGSGASDVPADVAETYRTFNPGATDAEIRRHYNKYLKSGG